MRADDRDPSAVAFSALERLGVPSIAARLYVEAVLRGAMSEEGLGRLAAGDGDVSWLEEQGFVFTEVDANNTRWVYPVDATLLSIALFDRFAWQAGVSRQSLGTLSEEERQLAAEIETLCERVALLGPGSKRGFPAGFTYVEGVGPISNLYVRLVDSADDILSVSAVEWTANLHVTWAHLVQRMRAGLKYRRIATVELFLAFGHSINERDVYEIGVDLRVAERSALREVFHIFGSGSRYGALVFDVPQFQLHGVRRATYVDNRGLVRRLRERGEAYWATAVDARRLFRLMKGLRESYLSSVATRLGDAAARLAGKIFDYGGFSVAGPEFSDAEAGGLRRKLAEAGFVIEHWTPIAMSAAIPNLMNEVTQFIRAASSREGP